MSPAVVDASVLTAFYAADDPRRDAVAARLGAGDALFAPAHVDWGTYATIAQMSTIASRDLRNHIADVLSEVSGGTTVTITVNGLPVAEIRPIRSARKQFLSKADLIEIMTARQADPGLREDLATLAGDTIDDLDPQ